MWACGRLDVEEGEGRVRKQPKKIYLAVDDNGTFESGSDWAQGRGCIDFEPVVWTNQKHAASYVRETNAQFRDDPVSPLRVVTYALVESAQKRKARKR